MDIQIVLEPQLEEDPEVQELLRPGRPRTPLPLSRRERLAEALVGGSFLSVALAMAVFLDAERGYEIAPMLVLVAAFAVVTQVQLDIGPGYTVPTQLVFVPMLLLLPTPVVPLLIAAGWALGKIPSILAGRLHPERLVLALGNSWFGVPPALVLALFDAQTPDWSDWPVYLAALLAQFVGDIVSAQAREVLGRGVAPRLQLRMLSWVYVIDASLAPAALLAAFASEEQPYVFLLLGPAVVMFRLFSHERTRRVDDALALTERSREAAELSQRLLEAERETRRGREKLLGGASAEILTPLGRLTALVYRLRSSGSTPEQRAALDAMLVETQQLRHLAGQFLDYTALKAGRDLDITIRPCALEPMLERVVGAFPNHGRIRLEVDENLPEVLADEGRTQQIVMNLVSNALKFSPDRTPVRVIARRDGDRVEVVVEDCGPGIPERERNRVFEELRRGTTANGTTGVGLGLFLSAVLAEAQDATLELDSREGEGSRFSLALNATP